MQTPTFRPALLALIAGLALSSSSSAQSTAADVLKLVQANLDKAPWQATVIGKFSSSGGTQEAEIGVQSVPGTDGALRMDFKKPAAMGGNFTVLTKKDAWSYLFVSNQVVMQPRASAKLNDLEGQIAGLGDTNSFSTLLTLKLAGEVGTPDGAAWKLSGVPKKAGQTFASAEVLILKSDPRPLSVSFKDAGGKVVGTLDIQSFKRATLSAKDLLSYPSDAAVVKK
ncbi:outer membrane lipoprotein carrier protein LolA [Deinococcus sp.]|uniref:outer membrane lipoprotein carrier protein LolA n=1 Tax=Deinococcus sp. TaxID=47478 RepID=UPI003C7B591E